MGLMLHGVYHVEDPGPDTTEAGEFRRARSTIRNWITPDGAPGPTGEGGFAAEPGRYHLYAAWNCPWAHRVLLARALLGLEDTISVAYARPRRTAEGWVYDKGGAFADPAMGVRALHEAYARAEPAYTGRITVPLLWDCRTGRAVSNESADIVRMLNDAFPGRRDLAPAALRPQIDAWNARIYEHVNNGVYKAGFARKQGAYDRAVTALFEVLDEVDARLAAHRFLCGDLFTEADLRLFPTLARFDVAYHGAFKCNRRRVMDYPNLWPYAREIFQMPGVAETVDFDIYRRGYYSPSAARNPLGIVPVGPRADWTAPPRRDTIGLAPR